jgi:hypothetical protein
MSFFKCASGGLAKLRYDDYEIRRKHKLKVVLQFIIDNQSKFTEPESPKQAPESLKLTSRMERFQTIQQNLINNAKVKFEKQRDTVTKLEDQQVKLVILKMKNEKQRRNQQVKLKQKTEEMRLKQQSRNKQCLSMDNYIQNQKEIFERQSSKKQFER